MLVSLFGNTYQEQSLPALRMLIDSLLQASMEVEVESTFYDWLDSRGAILMPCRRTDTPSPHSSIIISAGGDGTLLKATHWAADCNIAVAGINTGHLGYLTAWHMNDAEALVEAISSGSIYIEERSLIQVRSNRLPPELWPFALNDISLLKEKSGSMITIRTWIDGVYLTDYEADGLVIATPSGSTAYNLSAGGPILQPTVPALALTPVAPHTLTMRPLIVSDKVVIRTITSSRAGRFLLGIDGNTESLTDGTSIEISRAPFSLRLARRAGDDFAAALRNKLLWGTSLTARATP